MMSSSQVSNSRISVPWKVRLILLVNLVLPTVLIPVVFPTLGIVAATAIVAPSMMALLGVLTLITSGAILAWWEFLLRRMARALTAFDEEIATEQFLRYKWLFLVTYFAYVFFSAMSPAIIVPLAEFLLGIPPNITYYAQSSFYGAIQALMYYCVFFLIVDGILDEWGGRRIFNYQLERINKVKSPETLFSSSSRMSVIAFPLKYKYVIPTFIAAIAYSIILLILFRNGIASTTTSLMNQAFVFFLFTGLLLGTLYMQYRRLVIPVNDVLTKMKTLATGNLQSLSMEALVISNLDEIGENMLLTRVLVNNLINSAKELIENAEHVGRKASEYQQSFESLLSVATDIAQSMNEVATDAERIADNMQAINKTVSGFKSELAEFDRKIRSLHASMKDLLKELNILALNSFIELARAQSSMNSSPSETSPVKEFIGVFSTLTTEVQDLTSTTSRLNEQIKTILENLKDAVEEKFNQMASNVEETTQHVTNLSSQFEESLAAVEEETAIISGLQQPTEELVEIARKLESLASAFSKTIQ